MSNYNTENPVLLRFFDNLPDYPRCTDTLKAGCRAAPKEVAAKRRYIECNKPNYSLAHLNFDLDYEGAYFATHDLDLPPETICVINRTSGKGHIDYELSTPVHLGGNASEAAIRYLDVVRKVYTRKLCADASFGGLLSKNPLSDAWRVYTWDVTYTLDELAEPLRDISREEIRALPDDDLWHEHLRKYYMPLFEQRGSIPRRIDPSAKKPKKSRMTSDDPTDSLFVYHNTRWYGYKITADCERRSVLYREIEAYIRKLDRDFSLNLRESQIRADAKSITKFCWEHRDEFIAKRIAFCELQRERAYRSHKARKRNTATKISYARQKLRKEGKLITKSAIAEAAGLDKDTLSKRRIKTDISEIRSGNAYQTNEIRKAATEKKIIDAVDAFLRAGRKITKSAIAREAGISREAVSRYYVHLFPKV